MGQSGYPQQSHPPQPGMHNSGGRFPVVSLARQQRNWWLSLSPAERATHLGLPTTGQTIPLQLPLLEATMRAELLNGVLPERVITSAMQKGNTTILDLLFLTFQTYLPLNRVLE